MVALSNALLGCCLTVGAVILYVVNGFLMQASVRFDFQNPFAMIWFCHSAMAVLVPVTWIWDRWARQRHRQKYHRTRQPASSRPRQIFSSDAITLSFLNMGANYLLMFAAKFASNTETNAIFQASIAPVYVLMLMLGLESVSGSKVVAVLIIVFGVVVLTGLRRGAASMVATGVPHEILGDALALGASCSYAA